VFLDHRIRVCPPVVVVRSLGEPTSPAGEQGGGLSDRLAEHGSLGQLHLGAVLRHDGHSHRRIGAAMPSRTAEQCRETGETAQNRHA
jgi:hypothetical protein